MFGAHEQLPMHHRDAGNGVAELPGNPKDVPGQGVERIDASDVARNRGIRRDIDDPVHDRRRRIGISDGRSRPFEPKANDVRWRQYVFIWIDAMVA